MTGPILAVGILLLAGMPPGAAETVPETDGRLSLEIITPGEDVHVGDEVDFELRFENVSGDSLQIYHPGDSVYSYRSEWTLDVRVVDPGGGTWDFEPNWQYSMIRMPRNRDFRWLAAGDAIRFPFMIEPVDDSDQWPDYPVSGGGEVWFVSIPVSVDRWSIDRDSLRQATGITHFDTYGVSSGDSAGSREYLKVISVLEAVFRNPGTYRIEVNYQNGVNEGYRDGPDTGEIRFQAHEDCWTGRLSASTEFEVKPRRD